MYLSYLSQCNLTVVIGTVVKTEKEAPLRTAILAIDNCLIGGWLPASTCVHVTSVLAIALATFLYFCSRCCSCLFTASSSSGEACELPFMSEQPKRCKSKLSKLRKTLCHKCRTISPGNSSSEPCDDIESFDSTRISMERGAPCSLTRNSLFTGSTITLNSLVSRDFNHARFTVEKKIGKGQFSEVYKAHDKVTGDFVALKKICTFEAMDARARLDCLKEINLLQQLDHPNIVKHLGSYIFGNDLYIVLELAGGGDLSRLLTHFINKSRSIPEETIWKYFKAITSALAHMHDKRVMHRDIKPANVFMTVDGQPKLGDLGLGRFFSCYTNDAHSLVGTPYYMSPERIKEKGYNFKSDIWSLGCLLYEMAALQSPFYGERMNLFSLCLKIEACDYPPLPNSRSHELKTTIALCLNPYPEHRPDATKLHEIACQAVAHYASLNTFH